MDEPGWAVLARTPEIPSDFAISALGSFMTSASQDLGLTSPPKDSTFHTTVSPSLHLGIGIDIFGQRERVPPTGHHPTPLPAAMTNSKSKPPHP